MAIFPLQIVPPWSTVHLRDSGSFSEDVRLLRDWLELQQHLRISPSQNSRPGKNKQAWRPWKAPLNGALVRLQAQLCVFSLLQDPVELLGEGVVEGRHAHGLGLLQQHVAVAVDLPQHAGQRGRQTVGVVHVGQRGRQGKRRGWGRRSRGGQLALTRYDLQEAIGRIAKSGQGDGAAALAAVAVAAEAFELKVGAWLSLAGPQDLQPLLGPLPVPSSQPGAEADVQQHHRQHQAEASQNRHQGDVHSLHVPVRPQLRGQGGRSWRRGLLGGAAAAAGGRGAAGEYGRVAGGCRLQGEQLFRVHPDRVEEKQDGHRVLHGEAAVGAALLRTSSDDEEAVRPNAVARIQAVSREVSPVKGPARGRKIGAQLTLEEHVVARRHRALPVDYWGAETERTREVTQDKTECENLEWAKRVQSPWTAKCQEQNRLFQVKLWLLDLDFTFHNIP